MTTKVQPMKTCNCCLSKEVELTGKTCGVDNCSGYVCGDCLPSLNKHGLAGKCPLCRKESEQFVDSSIKTILPIINENTVFIFNSHNGAAQRRLLARLLINQISIDGLNVDAVDDDDDDDDDDDELLLSDLPNTIFDVFKILIKVLHYIVLLICILLILFGIGLVICVIIGLRDVNILEILIVGFISVFIFYCISLLCMRARARDLNVRRVSRPNGRNNVRHRDIIV